ncbi:MAG: radical SAM protein [Candidatus Hydrogenedentota bacterium]
MKRKFPEKTGFEYLNNPSKHRIALVYPDDYRVAMSNLGFIYLYQQLLKNPGIYVERFFNVSSDESGSKLSSFNTIFVSIPYENLILNFIDILEASGMGVNKRTNLIIAGGVAVTMNPLLIKDIVDLIYLGEVDERLETILYNLLRLKKRDFIEWAINEEYFIGFNINEKYPKKPERVKDLNKIHTLSQVISANTVFSNTTLVEFSRGCSSKCKFCVTGNYTGSRRQRDALSFIKLIESDFCKDFPKKLGIIGSDIRPDRELNMILDYLIQSRYITGFSSLRFELIKDLLIVEKLKKLNVKTITLAPEVGTARMSKIIDKYFSLDEIMGLAQNLANMGFKNIKFYFIVGLPYEEDEDIMAIVEIAKLLRGLKCRIHFSISGFVPKPWTPFEKIEINPLETLSRIAKIRKEISKYRNVKLSCESGKEFIKEYLLSRADSDFILRLKESFLNYRALPKFLKETAKNVDNNLDLLHSLIAVPLL